MVTLVSSHKPVSNCEHKHHNCPQGNGGNQMLIIFVVFHSWKKVLKSWKKVSKYSFILFSIPKVEVLDLFEF